MRPDPDVAIARHVSFRRSRRQRVDRLESRRDCPVASITTTTFASTNDLLDAMRRAAAALGNHEQSNGHSDANWPDRYAAYMAAEQAGTELPMSNDYAECRETQQHRTTGRGELTLDCRINKEI